MTPQAIHRFRKTKRFEKEYNSLPSKIRDKFDFLMHKMQQSYNQSSLRIKIHDRNRKIWEARIDIKYRFTFTLDGSTLELRRIGTHDIYRNP